MKLDNKVALIIGGTSGIGLAAAELFRHEGAKVVVVGTDPERLRAAQARLGDSGVAIAANLRRLAEIDALIQSVQERHRRINVLFANAGLGRAAPLEAVTDAQFDEQVEVNLKGLFFAIQKAVPLMGAGGSIVLTTSFLNTKGTSGLSILSATKAAVRSLAPRSGPSSPHGG